MMKTRYAEHLDGSGHGSSTGIFFNPLLLKLSLSSSLFLDSLQFNVNNFPHAISISKQKTSLEELEEKGDYK